MVMSACFVVHLCVFFFFKQKTAYEMRISDWSSDVCSSDLDGAGRHRRMARDGVLYFCRIDILAAGNDHVLHAINHIEIAVLVQIAGIAGVHPAVAQRGLCILRLVPVARPDVTAPRNRSEERRVGKECVSTCESRWLPYHTKQKK